MTLNNLSCLETYSVEQVKRVGRKEGEGGSLLLVVLAADAQHLLLPAPRPGSWHCRLPAFLKVLVLAQELPEFIILGASLL